MPERAEPAYIERKRELMKLKDEDLLRQIYDHVSHAIPNERAEDFLDGIYWLVDEAAERWAPIAAWLDRVQQLRQGGTFAEDIQVTREIWLETISERLKLAEEAAA